MPSCPVLKQLTKLLSMPLTNPVSVTLPKDPGEAGTARWEEAGVTVAPAVSPPGQPARRGLRRGSLTKELIVAESLRLLDDGGLDGFSLPKLGRALGADQTAVYRHFASKDDLVLAIADRLIEQAMTGLEPRACWVDTLTEMTRRLRLTYLAHPAAASMSAYRTTQGPAEIATVNIIIEAVLAAGFDGPEAAIMYRAVGDFALAFAGFEASFLALDKKAQQHDRAAWTQAYLSVGQAEFPAVWRIRTLLPEVEDDDIFETVLGLVMAGMRQRAPRPCDCHPLATPSADPPAGQE
jgi:TetR/AcrR family tetracycline transcriptional repressor